MKHHATLIQLLLLLMVTTLPYTLLSQCETPEVDLPDIENNVPQAYCVTYNFNVDDTGAPDGISMDLTHTFQGDLGITVEVNGVILAIMHRPGTVRCGGGCDCGNGNDLGGNYVFSDGGGPDPENGLAGGGGDYGISTADPCLADDVDSFAELFAGVSGDVTAVICITDYANADRGTAANITFLFPNPAVCGCTDPNAINWDPDASIDDGSCLFCPPSLDVLVDPFVVDACPGASFQMEAFTTAVDPFYEWFGSGGEEDFMDDNQIFNPTVTIPDDYTGTFTYTVIVTNNIGCMEEFDVTVNIIPPFEPVIDGDAFVCPDGESTLFVTGGSFANIEWSSGERDVSSIQAEAGDYSVTVSDANGCQATAEFTVEEYELEDFEISGPTEFCPESVPVRLFVEGPYTNYRWSTGGTTEEIFVSAEGEYTVTVTDANGCDVESSTVLLERDPTEFEIFGNTTFCEGSSTTLEVDPGFVSFEWSTGDRSFTTTVTTSGIYSVTVGEADGCLSTNQIEVTALPPPDIDIAGPSEVCPGGQIQLEVTNGYPTVSWDGAPNNATVTITAPGTYTVSVIDDNGCTNTRDVTIIAAPVPVIEITGDDLICVNGSGTLTVTDGYAEYDWSTGSTTNTTEVTAAGTYSVLVTNTSGCTAIEQFTVDARDLPTPTIVGDESICPDASTTLTANPGYVTYTWSSGEMTETITTNEPDQYEVTVTDDLGCEGVARVNVIGLDNPRPTIAGDLILCETEVSTLIVEQAYSVYAWSNGSNTPNVQVSDPGIIMVTVTDDEGCQGETSVTLEEIIPSVNILGEPIFCEDENTTLSLDGAFSAYSWSTGGTTEMVTTNQTGDVMVEVTDENGCIATDTITLDTWSLPVVDITGRLSFCPGTEATLNATSGFVSYDWSTGDSGTTSINTDTPGDYSVSVVDDNGCRNNTTAQVLEEENLSPQILGDLEFCAGTNTVLTGSGGFTVYNWSNNVSGDNVTITAPGDYTLSVEDEFGCSGSTTVTVAELALPTPAILGDLEYCAETSTELQANTTYMAYQWNEAGETMQSLTVSAPGTYQLTVTDDNNCQGSTEVMVVENALPTPVIQGLGGYCPGELTTLTAPPGFTAYEWTTGSTNTEITVGVDGAIGLEVVDDNGCRGSTSRDINVYATSIPAINGPLQFCPGTSTDLTTDNGFAEYQWSTGSADIGINTNQIGDVTLTVVDNNGCETENTVALSNFIVTPPSIDAPAGFCADASAQIMAESGYTSYQWTSESNAGFSENTADITVANGGIYQVNVVDANGCASNNAVAVDAYALPTPQIGGSTTFCIGNSTTLNAGATYAQYSWSDGSNTPEIVVNTPGVVELTVTDENGCVGDTNQNIIEATELSPVVSGDLAYCEGQETILSAGSGFATYDWSNGETSSSIIVSEPGTYTLSVTDSGGCDGNTTVTVIENVLPDPTISGILAFCEGAATTLQGVGGYTSYDWSTGAPTSSIDVTMPALYGLTVTDANGCVDSSRVNVATQALPVFSLQGDTDFCAGATTEISVQPAYASYNWGDGSADQMIILDDSGLVAVTVTDEFGCESTGSVNVNRIPLPEPDAGPNTILDCDVRSVRIGTFDPNDGTDWAYTWSGPGINSNNQNQALPSVGAGGDYSLVVTDNEFGCVSEAVGVTVTDLEYVPQVVLSVLDTLDCATETVTIDARGTASGNQYIYQWFDETQQPIAGANGLSLSASIAQLYVLEVLDTLTGCDNSEAIEVAEDLTYPLAEAGPQQLLTCDVPSIILDGSNSQGGGQITYTWSSDLFGGGSIGSEITATITEPGWYFLEVRDRLNDCSNIDSVFVDQNIVAPLAVAGQDFELDCNIPVTSLNGAGSATNNVTYQWFTSNGTAIDGATDLEYTVSIPDVYSLQVTSLGNGCVGVDEVIISINEEAPQGLDIVSDVPTCAGDSDGAIILANVQGGVPPYLYSLNGGEFSGQIVFENLSAGNYQFTVEDATGCQYTSIFELADGNNLQLDLGEDIYIDQGDQVDIFPEILTVDSSQLRRIEWLANQGVINCDDCLIQENITPNTSMQFFLELVDENGCSVRDNLTVFVNRRSNIFVPNVFSPNGDDDNDIFYIFSDNTLVEIKQFLVFNRWGEAVFEVYNGEPNNPAWGWDGTYRGQPVNPAVYVWFAEVEMDDGTTQILKGDVAIMR